MIRIEKYNFNHNISSREEIIEIFKDIPEALENNYNFPKDFHSNQKK